MISKYARYFISSTQIIDKYVLGIKEIDNAQYTCVNKMLPLLYFVLLVCCVFI